MTKKEKEELNGQAPTAIEKKRADLAQQFDRYVDKFASASPYQMEMARFKTIALNSIYKNPDLMQCDIRSLLLAIMDAAQYGLVPDSHAKEGYLIPFKGKATFIPGYMGAVTLANRSGYLADLDVHPVFEKDEFDFWYGMNPDLIHKPCMDEDKGEFVACYVVFEKKDGKKRFHVLSKHDGLRHKKKFAMAKKKDGTIVGPWVDHFESQCLKTVIIEGLKYVPKSANIQQLITKEENLEDGLLDQDDSFIDIEPAKDPSFKKENNGSNGQEQKETPKADDTPGDQVDLVSADQIKEINNLANLLGLKTELENILERYNIKTVEGLPVSKYDDVINELISKGA